MADLFEIYQDNITSVFYQIGRILDNINLKSSDKSESLINEAETHIKEAERIIKNMEIQSFTNNNDNSIFIKNYRIGLDQYKKRIGKIKETISSNKKLDTMLLTTESTDRKEKLIENEEVAWSSFQKLENAKRSTIELENISIDIMKDLNNQNDKMKGIGKNINEMNNSISTSNSLMNRMMRRQHRNKLIVFVFSIGLIMTFVFILYFRLSASNSTDDKNMISKPDVK